MTRRLQELPSPSCWFTTSGRALTQLISLSLHLSLLAAMASAKQALSSGFFLPAMVIFAAGICSLLDAKPLSSGMTLTEASRRQS